MMSPPRHARPCRHYTFYIWKDFLAVHPAAKYTLVPAYLYCAWSVWWSLLQGRQPLIWVMGLAAASALTLVPAWLVDFRCALRSHAFELIYSAFVRRSVAGMLLLCRALKLGNSESLKASCLSSCLVLQEVMALSASSCMVALLARWLRMWVLHLLRRNSGASANVVVFAGTSRCPS